MLSSEYYLARVEDTLRDAERTADGALRQEFLRQAIAWNAMAQDARKREDDSRAVIPFQEPPENPLADDSDV